MGNVPKGSLLAPGGAVTSPGPDSDLCKAYRTAVEKYCIDKQQGTERNFNDYVFDELDANGSPLASVLRNLREKPIGYLGPSGRVYSLLRGAASNDKILAALATVLGATTTVATRGSESLYRCIRSNKVRGKLTGFSVDRVLCPDSTYPAGHERAGRPIEIKRPTEGESHPGQLNNYAKAGPDGKCDLVNCASCKLPCENWEDDCQGPFPM